MDAFKVAGLPVLNESVSQNELVVLKLITSRNRDYVTDAMELIAKTDGMKWDGKFRTTPDKTIAVAMMKGTEVIGFQVYARNIAPVEYFLVPLDRRDWDGTGVNTHGEVSAMKYGCRNKSACRLEGKK